MWKVHNSWRQYAYCWHICRCLEYINSLWCGCVPLGDKVLIFLGIVISSGTSFPRKMFRNTGTTPGDKVSHRRRVYLRHHCGNLKSCMFWVDSNVPCNYTQSSRNFLLSLISICCFGILSIDSKSLLVCTYILACLTHWGRVTQICVFNTRFFSLHNTLNYAIHRAFLRMVLLTDVYRNLTSLWINL